MGHSFVQVIMQMHKYSKIIVEKTDLSFITLKFLSTGTMFFFFFYYCYLFIYFRIFILFNSVFIATFYYLGFILTYVACTYIYIYFVF